MEQQTIEKADRLTNVEANEPASQQIADLNLTDAEANQIKGGPVCHGTTVLAWARVDGVSASNHNETMSYDETDLDELEDLLLSATQESDIKAGRDNTGGSQSAGFAYAVLTVNHNETVAEDGDLETTALADLPVADDKHIKGGPVVLPDLLVTGYQHSGSAVAAQASLRFTHKTGALRNLPGNN